MNALSKNAIQASGFLLWTAVTVTVALAVALTTCGCWSLQSVTRAEAGAKDRSGRWQKGWQADRQADRQETAKK